jgi:hypothetical protein
MEAAPLSGTLKKIDGGHRNTLRRLSETIKLLLFFEIDELRWLDL